MSQPKARRFVAVLSLSAALFLLPLADAQAAQRQRRGESDLIERIERRALSLWSSIIGMWEMIGGRIDDNG